jgi:hypothetical protein
MKMLNSKDFLGRLCHTVGFDLHKGGQVSISPTFYEQLLRQIPFAKK